MNLLFAGAVAGNGFNSLGHYLRAEPLVSDCTAYVTRPAVGCSSNFAAVPASSGSASATSATAASAGNASAGAGSGGTGSAGTGSAGSDQSSELVTQAVRKARPAAKSASVLQGLVTYLTRGGR